MTAFDDQAPEQRARRAASDVVELDEPGRNKGLPLIQKENHSLIAE